MNTDSTFIFKLAVSNTKQNMPQYYHDVLEQRLYTNGAGSRTQYDTIESLDAALDGANWVDITDELDPAVKAPECVYLATTDITGWNGLLDIDSMDDSEMLEFIDTKNTGRLSIAATRNSSEYPQCLPLAKRTVAILGPEDGIQILYTFHPGDPIPMSTFKVGEHENGISYHPGMRITAKEAKELGFKHAKLLLK